MMPPVNESNATQAGGARLRLAIPVLLPDVGDSRDACVARLTTILEGRRGVQRVHVEETPESAGSPTGSLLCLHYDPEQITLADLERMAVAAGAELTNQFAHATIPVRMVGAEDDGLRIEAALRALPGVTAAVVNTAAQAARVEFDRTRIDLSAIEAEFERLGVTAGADETPEDGADGRGWYGRNHELVWSLTAGALVAAGWAMNRATPGSNVATGLFVGAYFFGAWDNLRHLWAQLRRGRFAFNIDLLMLVAAAGAAALGEWFEGSLLLFLFSLGHALEHYALGRARNAIKALAELAPQHATVIRNDREMKVPIAEVVAGDQVVVKPAERLPADGTVRDGRSAVNQAPITGESLPVDKGPGDQVFAGTVNGEGALVVTVTAAIGDRTIDRVIQLVSEAQTQKAPTQQFTDRFERVFVPVVLVVDVLLMVVPPLLGISTWPESIYRGMAMLIAASPCALALGTPAAVLAGLAQAARNGVLIKGGAYLETLGSIRSVALDKTGTITKGTPAVMELAPADGVQADELLQLAAAVEKRSQHPLAHAILSAAETRGLTIPAAGELESVTGRGVRAVVGAHHIEVGRLLMFEEPGAPAIPAAIRETVTRIEAAGQTTMVVRRSTAGQPVGKANSEWLGVIGVADELRPGVRATLDQLRQAGVRRIIMLTGDNEGAANAVGTAVGIDEVWAGLMPEDKVAAVRELAAAGGVAMIGDGVNDAPALATATVGIAMGGAGTAAALETADMALMGDDLGRLPFAMGLSRQARIIIQQNLFVSLTVIAVLVVVTGLGIAGIGLAVVIHEGSTLVVVANGLRLLAFRGGQDLAPAPKPGSS